MIAPKFFFFFRSDSLWREADRKKASDQPFLMEARNLMHRSNRFPKARFLEDDHNRPTMLPQFENHASYLLRYGEK